jgi:hypothetical protein
MALAAASSVGVASVALLLLIVANVSSLEGNRDLSGSSGVDFSIVSVVSLDQFGAVGFPFNLIYLISV